MPEAVIAQAFGVDTILQIPVAKFAEAKQRLIARRDAVKKAAQQPLV